MTVFMNGKQVRVRRPQTIDGMDEEEFVRHNADPIWLHQNGYWEILHEREMERDQESADEAPAENFDSQSLFPRNFSSE